MKIILKEDIKGTGKKGDIINASDGHAKNYLFPRKLAVEATPGNLAELKAKEDSLARKKNIEFEKSKEEAKKIERIMLSLKVKTGDNGKIFGGITSKEIAENLKLNYKIEVDKKKITLKDTIKSLGDYIVEIKLNEGVIAKLKISVIAE